MRFGVTPETRNQYHAFLKERSDAINDCILFLNDACKKAGEAYTAGHVGVLAVIALARHAVESLDGVCLLIEHGSVLPCYPLLRSVFDASLGVMYILQADSDKRGSAYFVTQIRQEIAFFERCDPTTNGGREIRRELQDDIAGQDALDGMALQDVQKHLADLQAELNDPLFSAAAQAWLVTNKKNPEWYSLFGGPGNLRDLAKSLRFLSGFEIHYRPWCRQVHATDTVQCLSENGDSIVLRPIRCPDGIQRVVRSAGLLALVLAGRLLDAFGAGSDGAAVARYKDLENRIKSLANVKAPDWRG